MGCGEDWDIIEPITIQNMSTKDYLKYLDWCESEDLRARSGSGWSPIHSSVRKEFGQFTSIDDWLENLHENREFILKYNLDVIEPQSDATKPHFGSFLIGRYAVLIVRAIGTRVPTHLVAVRKRHDYEPSKDFLKDVAYKTVYGEYAAGHRGWRNVVLEASSMFDSVFKMQRVITRYSHSEYISWQRARYS